MQAEGSKSNKSSKKNNKPDKAPKTPSALKDELPKADSSTSSLPGGSEPAEPPKKEEEAEKGGAKVTSGQRPAETEKSVEGTSASSPAEGSKLAESPKKEEDPDEGGSNVASQEGPAEEKPVVEESAKEGTSTSSPPEEPNPTDSPKKEKEDSGKEGSKPTSPQEPASETPAAKESTTSPPVEESQPAESPKKEKEPDKPSLKTPSPQKPSAETASTVEESFEDTPTTIKPKPLTAFKVKPKPTDSPKKGEKKEVKFDDDGGSKTASSSGPGEKRTTESPKGRHRFASVKEKKPYAELVDGGAKLPTEKDKLIDSGDSSPVLSDPPPESIDYHPPGGVRTPPNPVSPWAREETDRATTGQLPWGKETWVQAHQKPENPFGSPAAAPQQSDESDSSFLIPKPEDELSPYLYEEEVAWYRDQRERRKKRVTPTHRPPPRPRPVGAPAASFQKRPPKEKPVKAPAPLFSSPDLPFHTPPEHPRAASGEPTPEKGSDPKTSSSRKKTRVLSLAEIEAQLENTVLKMNCMPLGVDPVTGKRIYPRVIPFDEVQKSVSSSRHSSQATKRPPEDRETCRHPTHDDFIEAVKSEADRGGRDLWLIPRGSQQGDEGPPIILPPEDVQPIDVRYDPHGFDAGRSITTAYSDEPDPKPEEMDPENKTNNDTGPRSPWWRVKPTETSWVGVGPDTTTPEREALGPARGWSGDDTENRPVPADGGWGSPLKYQGPKDPWGDDPTSTLGKAGEKEKSVESHGAPTRPIPPDAVDDRFAGVPEACKTRFLQHALIVRKREKSLVKELRSELAVAAMETQAQLSRRDNQIAKLKAQLAQLAQTAAPPELLKRMDYLESELKKQSIPSAGETPEPANTVPPSRWSGKVDILGYGVMLVCAVIIIIYSNWEPAGAFRRGAYVNGRYANFHGGHFSAYPGHFTNHYQQQAISYLMAGVIGWSISRMMELRHRVESSNSGVEVRGQ